MGRRASRSPRMACAAVVMAVAGLVATSAGSALAAEADKLDKEKLEDFVEVLIGETAAIMVGDTAWVAISVAGVEDVSDLRFTGDVKHGASVSYPSTTSTFASPYNDDALLEGEVDFIAIQIAVPADVRKKHLDLQLDATWVHDGQPMESKKRTKVKVPLVDFAGDDDFALITETIDVPVAADGWVDVAFLGLAPRVEDFRLSVAGPADAHVLYPADGFTSLSQDAVLEDGETDVARFRLDEQHWMDPYLVELQITYVRGGKSESVRLVALIRVEK